MAEERLACVSVDLDTLVHYARIHGLPDAAAGGDPRGPVYRVALTRLMELFTGLEVPVTLFAIGEDLADPAAAAALRQAHDAGAEIANHSHRHPYALSRATPAELEAEIGDAEEAIAAAVGERPLGFRAPGYALSAEAYRTLERRGYRYDSSVFPAAPYYLAKAAVMAGMRLTGRRSRAVLDDPSVLAAPRRPYSPDPARPYRRGPGRVRELPLSVTRVTRLPFFGTGVTTWPGWLTRRMYDSFRAEPFLNLELHAVDVLDSTDGVPEAIVRHQPGLGVPASRKSSRLAEVVGWIRSDFTTVRLREAAERAWPP